jgi:hypothetical protein
LISGLGAVALLTIVNGLLVLIVIKKHGQVYQWRQLIAPAIAGLVLTIIEVIAIDWLRSTLTAGLGLPF